MNEQKQVTDCLVMVRPLHFCMNEQTAITNHFQQADKSLAQSQLLTQVQHEFDHYVRTLQDHHIDVIILEDRNDVITPDSIFPNNWIVTDVEGNVSLFPMCAPNRRVERRNDIFDILRNHGYVIDNIIDWSISTEEVGIFLEGTGSMLLDRVHRKAYCALSPRSDETLFHQFCKRFHYQPITFHANQTIASTDKRAAIYHTNVMLTLAETFAVICLDCIDDVTERALVQDTMIASGKEIIAISEAQVACFAGNMLQVSNQREERYLVMSRTAFNCLSEAQRVQINKHCPIITVDIPTIEKLGGGSVRCMLAEIFLPRK